LHQFVGRECPNTREKWRKWRRGKWSKSWVKFWEGRRMCSGQ
jgi:hypothetical protein